MESYRKKIRKLIEQYNQENNFYKEDEGIIQETEEKLNVKFPESYRWFLKEYGSEGDGLNFNGCKDILYYHNRFKSFDLPKAYIVIQHCDEYSYCLDTEKKINNECPVVNWSAFEKGVYPVVDNFYEYLLEEINNAIENDWWEEG
ncbi:SMI1/KNR4 family protein [Priestia aryabhattai]|uniref:SMI1/KNR4 family protein n=1 Tax=Priestia aryabhattai TaxID=412384 RepID=UPI00187690A8|nr:SMI1/KNR4 family protein [Priestia aryabhattai]MBE5098039.1 SMI1/KNR4 family protein [Priestia aryabhattai]